MMKNRRSRYKAIVAIVFFVLTVFVVPMISRADDGTRDMYHARDKIRQFYHDILEREPDDQGYQYWLQQYKNGMPLAQIEKAFYNSPEYQQKKQGKKTGYESVDQIESPRGLIIDFYNQLIGRKPTDAELAHWLKDYSDGDNLESIRSQIAQQSK